MFLRKSVLKICRKFTGEQPRQSVVSVNLPNKCIEIALRHGCSPVNLLHIFRTPFYKNTSGGLLLISATYNTVSRNLMSCFAKILNRWTNLCEVLCSSDPEMFEFK